MRLFDSDGKEAVKTEGERLAEEMLDIVPEGTHWSVIGESASVLLFYVKTKLGLTEEEVITAVRDTIGMYRTVSTPSNTKH